MSAAILRRLAHAEMWRRFLFGWLLLLVAAGVGALLATIVDVVAFYPRDIGSAVPTGLKCAEIVMVLSIPISPVCVVLAPRVLKPRLPYLGWASWLIVAAPGVLIGVTPWWFMAPIYELAALISVTLFAKAAYRFDLLGKGCPAGMIPWVDIYGNQVCKRP